MTGQGQGRRVQDHSDIRVEVRAVNNRFLKVQLRTPDGLTNLEPQIENLVRQSLKRGSLQMSVFVSYVATASDFRLQEVAMESYYRQCRGLAERLGISTDVNIGQLLVLPGVIQEKDRGLSESNEDLVTTVLATVRDALECLNRMRQSEGEAMADELLRQLRILEELIRTIEQRLPLVAGEYRERLKNKLQQALAAIGAEVQPSDLIREVQLFVERSDIREEIVRLRSHNQQFETLLQEPESQGRKLDFLVQEMYREINTIGSKAADAEITQRVVDAKAVIEQMRELIQNAE